MLRARQRAGVRRVLTIEGPVTWIAGALYVVVGRWLVATRARATAAAFAVLNVAAVSAFFLSWAGHIVVPVAVVYLSLVLAQYVALRVETRTDGRFPWVAFLLPITALVVARWMPVSVLARFGVVIRAAIEQTPAATLASYLVGLSYLAFRTSHLVLDVRNGVVPPPNVWEYLGFAFFAPTLAVGPINPYSNYRRAFAEGDRPDIPSSRALMRVVVGLVKFKFLGPLCDQLAYSGLLLDTHPHHWIDLPVAAVAYYLYLYCNFSGACDVAIGVAGLIGIPVAENFDRPFAARNVRDFWNRWHITLTNYMRDVVFSPLSRWLVRVGGAARANHAIAVAIVVVFLLVGVWHGVGWNYLAFGALHALGVTVNHYYGIALKRRLGKERFAAYGRSPWIRAAAVSLTFVYIAGTLFVFANSPDAMHRIFTSLRSN
ncbi:unnamed protein product [uncultured bacterium]|nr:unnamed protein product [uncultured bacterium]